LNDFIEKHKDVYKHFITKKNNQEAKFYKDSIDKVMAKAEYTFTKAEVPSAKSDQLSSDQVIKLKTDIAEVMKNVPSTALAIMIRNWHSFRLENSGYWTALKNDSFMVDSSLLKEIIHPDTNVQGGRVTKNLEKLEMFIMNAQIYLDGISHDNGKH
jgi:hypothetical protein